MAEIIASLLRACELLGLCLSLDCNYSRVELHLLKIAKMKMLTQYLKIVRGEVFRGAAMTRHKRLR